MPAAGATQAHYASRTVVCNSPHQRNRLIPYVNVKLYVKNLIKNDEFEKNINYLKTATNYDDSQN